MTNLKVGSKYKVIFKQTKTTSFVGVVAAVAGDTAYLYDKTNAQKKHLFL